MKDGVHKGDENDPRISLIEVIPEEIRYWMATKGTIGRAIGIGAMPGNVVVTGELRTITPTEVGASPEVHMCCVLTLSRWRVVDQASGGFAFEVNESELQCFNSTTRTSADSHL